MRGATAILIRETENAFQIMYEGDTQWVPRSLVTYIRKEPPDAKGQREITFDLEPWKAKQLGWE